MTDILATMRGVLADAGAGHKTDTEIANMVHQLHDLGLNLFTEDEITSRDRAMAQREREACAEIAERAKELYLSEAMKATEPKPDGEPTDVVLGWDQIFVRYANVASAIAENIKERGQ